MNVTPQHGQLIGPRKHLVTTTEVVRYAGAAGDYTPVHHDVQAAAAAGFDRLFAMGMLSVGYLASLLEDSFGVGAVRALEARFRDRVWVGEVVECSGEVTKVEDGSAQFELLVTVDGRTVIDGRATVMLAEEGR
jgi:acyl dehydratase